MKALKPGSFGHRGLIGKKVVAKEANRVSAKCAICDSKSQQIMTTTTDHSPQLITGGRGAGPGPGPGPSAVGTFRRVGGWMELEDLDMDMR
jgi:hypothetical protein